MTPTITEQAEAIIQQHAPSLRVERHRGQLRFAERFVSAYADRFLYAHGLDWHEWDGSRWAECRDGAPHRAVRALLKEALRELVDLDGDERKALFIDISKVETIAGANGTLAWASKLEPCAVAAEQLDARPELFNTVSGTVNLDTGEIYPPRPADRLTKIAGAAFDPDARSALFDGFLSRILPDEQVRAFVQRLFGYAMLGEVREHIMPIFTGVGRNGKGTLRDAVMAAFGDYAIEVEPDLLMERRGEVHSTEKTDLKGARLVFCSETEQGRRFNESLMKRLVGGDPIRARRMRQDTITFDPSHTLVMLTNHLPKVSDDPAVWARILVVPFDVVIPPEERDGTLPAKLKAERAAVLAWVYRGWLEYQRVGLAPPEAVRLRTAEYQADSDVLYRFLEEETVSGSPAMTVRASKLFEAWSDWCRRNGEFPGDSRTFGKAIKKRGYESFTSNGTVYRGLALRHLEETAA